MGGAERLTMALAERMTARGHQVLAVVLKGPHGGDLKCPVEVVHLGMEQRPASAVSGAARAMWLLRGFGPDVIHSHGFQANMLARLVGAVTPGVRVVSTIHNVYEGGRMRMLAYRLTDGLAGRTVAVCEAAARRFEALSAVSRCGVVRNGIEVDGFAPDSARRIEVRGRMGVGDEFVWLAVGRDAPAKNYPGLLTAFEQVQRERPEVQLWIAGAEGASVEGVRWLGMRGDVAELMDGADGFVMSSAWEGMPLAVAEAMAMGKPVVATDVGGVQELGGECGFLVGAGDMRELARAMLEVMDRSAGDREALGIVARQRILEEFGMERCAEEWEREYRPLGY